MFVCHFTFKNPINLDCMFEFGLTIHLRCILVTRHKNMETQLDNIVEVVRTVTT